MARARRFARCWRIAPGRQLVQRVPRRSTRPARDVRKQVGDAGHLGHLGLARASPTQGQ
jgi:hypothetical protein